MFGPADWDHEAQIRKIQIAERKNSDELITYMYIYWSWVVSRQVQTQRMAHGDEDVNRYHPPCLDGSLR